MPRINRVDNRNFSIKQLLEISACTNCRICAEVCPAVSASLDGELSAIHRIKGLNRILKSWTGLFRKLLSGRGLSDEILKHFSETVFRCTLCGNCEEICPVGIRLRDLWLSLRQDMVHSGFYPKKSTGFGTILRRVTMFLQRIMRSGPTGLRIYVKPRIMAI